MTNEHSMTNEQKLLVDSINAESDVLYEKLWSIIERQNISQIAIASSLHALSKVTMRVIMSVDSREQKDTLFDFVELLGLEFERIQGLDDREGFSTGGDDDEPA